MDLGWLVAVVEPDLLIGYDHSSDRRAVPEAELARVMLGRTLPSPFDDEIEDLSVRAVHDAVQGDEHAVDVLVESLSAEETRRDLDKFAALTLVACALLADRDDIPTCLNIIDDALGVLDAESASTELCKALILQQRALRHNDIGEPTASDLDEVRHLVDQLQFNPYPVFAVQANAGTLPRAAVQNIIDALRSAAAGFDLSASSSQQVSQVISDIEDDQLVQYRRWLDDAYKARMDQSTPAGYGPDLYFQNLRLEVLGHRRVYRSRRELAMMRILRFTPTLPSAVAADCLRLFRLAGADSELRRLVDSLTFAGPVSPLLVEGRRIDAHRTSDRSLRTAEMIILAAAAEVMAPSEAFQVLARVLSVIRGGGPTTAPLHWQADFAKDEQAWIAAAALAGAAGTAGVVARELLSYATPDRLADIASDTVIAKIIRTIAWTDIEGDLRDRWRQLASTQAVDHPGSPAAAAIRHALGTDSELSVGYDDSSLSDLAESINHYLRIGQPIPGNLRQAAKRTALSSLARIADEASAGTFVVRVAQPAEIVAVLLAQSPDEDAWSGLLEFLTNPLVARSEKSRALDILVRERPYLVAELAARYTEPLVSLILEPDLWAFDDPHRDSVFVSALNFAYVYGFVADEVVADYLRTLASSADVQMRREAGRSLSVLVSTSMGDWMLPKVYALSGDSDPTVRVAVARALGEICQRHSVVGDMAIERLSELLQSGGVFVPLHTLGQLTPQVLTAPRIDRIVQQLRNDSQSWRVRKRAAQLLG